MGFPNRKSLRKLRFWEGPMGRKKYSSKTQNVRTPPVCRPKGPKTPNFFKKKLTNISQDPPPTRENLGDLTVFNRKTDHRSDGPEKFFLKNSKYAQAPHL